MDNFKNMSRLALVACVLVLLPAAAVFAAKTRSLKDYKDDIVHLRGDFGVLLFPDEDMSGVDLIRYEKEALEEVGEFVADYDAVEFEGVEVAVDNAWLRDKVNEYGSGKVSYEQRVQIFASIYERLGAIEGKLDELEQSLLKGPSKDENKRKLAGILGREEYRGPSENADQSLAARALKWISDMIQKLFPPRKAAPPKLSPIGTGGLTYVLQIVLYALVLALIGFLIYKFAPLIAKRRRQKNLRPDRDRIVLGEKIAAGATTEELFSEAEKLANEGRLREALRKGYIAMLFGLGEKKLIGLAKHKTNRDYLKEISGRSELRDVVSGLTVTYEKHWYGSLEADENDWTEFRGNYARAVRTGRN